MYPPRPGTPLGTSTMTPRPNRSGPCCSERGAAAGAARVTVSPTPMTIQLILYRGKRDNEEYTEILKSKSKRPQADLPHHELLSPPPFPPPNQHPLLDTRCGWLLGDTAVGGARAGQERPGQGKCWWGWQQGAHGTGAPWGAGSWCPCPHPGPQAEEEGEDEEEKEEVSLWICTDSGGNGLVSPGRFLI